MILHDFARFLASEALLTKPTKSSGKIFAELIVTNHIAIRLVFPQFFFHVSLPF